MNPSTIPSLEEQMCAIPVLNSAAEITSMESGRIRLAVPLSSSPSARFKRILFRLPKKKAFELDPLGAELFTLIDGRRTIEEIIDAHALRWKLSFYESRLMTLQYLQRLMHRGAVALTLPRGPQP